MQQQGEKFLIFEEKEISELILQKVIWSSRIKRMEQSDENNKHREYVWSTKNRIKPGDNWCS